MKIQADSKQVNRNGEGKNCKDVHGCWKLFECRFHGNEEGKRRTSAQVATDRDGHRKRWVYHHLRSYPLKSSFDPHRPRVSFIHGTREKISPPARSVINFRSKNYAIERSS